MTFSSKMRVFSCVVAVTIAAAISHAQQLVPDAPVPAAVITANADPAQSFRLAEPPPKSRVADAKFSVLSALVMGTTIADLERTQHCLARGTCVELNPLLPHSRAGMYAVNVPVNAATMYLAYRLKSSGRKTWWIAPAVVAAGHLLGATVTF